MMHQQQITEDEEGHGKDEEEKDRSTSGQDHQHLTTEAQRVMGRELTETVNDTVDQGDFGRWKMHRFKEMARTLLLPDEK